MAEQLSCGYALLSAIVDTLRKRTEEVQVYRETGKPVVIRNVEIV